MNELQKQILTPFIEESITTLETMLDLKSSSSEYFEDDPNEFRFKGYAIAAKTKGKVNGVILMHHYIETADHIGNKLLTEMLDEEGNRDMDDPDLADAVAEWGNTAIGRATNALSEADLGIEFEPPYFITDTSTIENLLEGATQVLTAPIVIEDVGRYYFNYVLYESPTMNNVTSIKKSKVSKALVVDDTRFNRKQICKHLTKLGCENVLEAEDGNQAVDIALKESPDIVFMDLVMPECDGYEALKRIRAENKELPIVILSSVNEQAKIDACNALGIEGYIVKPITKHNASELIEPYLN